jgi:transcription elongation GreA/GreB family factor
MSRAFVKEEAIEAVQELPDKPISPHPNYVTPEGLTKLRERFAAYQARQAQLSRREDLSARQELTLIRRELRYLEQRLQSAVVVEPTSQVADRVHFGAWVEVADPQGNLYTYRIVGEDEADASKGYISWVSPLARALLDARVGDLVHWRRPVGEVELEVIAIRRSEG